MRIPGLNLKAVTLKTKQVISKIWLKTEIILSESNFLLFVLSGVNVLKKKIPAYGIFPGNSGKNPGKNGENPVDLLGQFE
jgi:hypothetical protein